MWVKRFGVSQKRTLWSKKNETLCTRVHQVRDYIFCKYQTGCYFRILWKLRTYFISLKC